MLFDFLNKVAQGMQFDCTSLGLPKVRSESALAWSSNFLRFDIECRPDDWTSTLRDLCM